VDSVELSGTTCLHIRYDSFTGSSRVFFTGEFSDPPEGLPAGSLKWKTNQIWTLKKKLDVKFFRLSVWQFFGINFSSLAATLNFGNSWTLI